MDNITKQAINQVTGNANPAFTEAAKQAIRECAQQYDEFTADDVWDKLKHTGIETHNNKALGGPISSLAKQKVIFNTGRQRKTTRKNNHSRGLTIWSGKKPEPEIETRVSPTTAALLVEAIEYCQAVMSADLHTPDLDRETLEKLAPIKHHLQLIKELNQ